MDTSAPSMTAASGVSGAVQPSLEGTLDTWPGVPEGGYSRVLLKLSGEAFAGGQSLGVDPDVVQAIARQIAAVVSVEKYGAPRPAPKMTTRPFSRCLIARRGT